VAFKRHVSPDACGISRHRERADGAAMAAVCTGERADGATAGELGTGLAGGTLRPCCTGTIGVTHDGRRLPGENPVLTPATVAFPRFLARKRCSSKARFLGKALPVESQILA
jgi:hypothetical protein